MSQNPYQASDVDDRVSGIISGSREDLRKVASAQKGVLFCILLQIGTMIGALVVGGSTGFILQIVSLVVGLAGSVFVFLLASRVYGTGAAIMAVIATLIPCVGLITLLVINQKATSVLQQNGINVGLLGATGNV